MYVHIFPENNASFEQYSVRGMGRLFHSLGAAFEKALTQSKVLLLVPLVNRG